MCQWYAKQPSSYKYRSTSASPIRLICWPSLTTILMHKHVRNSKNCSQTISDHLFNSPRQVFGFLFFVQKLDPRGETSWVHCLNGREMVPENWLLPVRGHCCHTLGLFIFVNKFIGPYIWGGNTVRVLMLVASYWRTYQHVVHTSLIFICLFQDAWSPL